MPISSYINFNLILLYTMIKFQAKLLFLKIIIHL
jgi:hypothetical protein